MKGQFSLTEGQAEADAEQLTSIESLPLLPRGVSIFASLPARAIVIDELLALIGDGLLTVTRNSSRAVVLVRDGAAWDGDCIDGGKRLTSADVWTLVRGWNDANLSADRMSPAELDVASHLLHGTVCYSDLRLEWTHLPSLLTELGKRHGTYVVELRTPAGWGVTSVCEGQHVATYTDSHPELGGVDLLVDIVKCGTGSIHVFRSLVGGSEEDASTMLSERHPAQAQDSRRSDSDSDLANETDTLTFANVFGAPAESRVDDTLTDQQTVRRREQPDLAYLLPDLKLLLRSRFQRSAYRLENVVELAASSNSSIDDLAHDVRRISIRGVTQATLDQVAEDMLTLAARHAQ